ncbi:MAG: DNA polymerase/3'-5' exonuclease PolX [Elusimicrobia bacterium]|nr:DNA polymerase/3'-5' exonuclease PolX [Elusimicrobiota bacterium]
MSLGKSITNSYISDIFAEMAVLLELAHENPFRVRAYQKAALAIEGLSENIASMPVEKILKIPGIGKGIASHLEEIAGKGAFSEFEKLKKRFPKGLLDIVNVQGIGAKRARALYDKLGIDSMEKLMKKAMAGEIRNLDGFGEKIEQNIILGVKEASERKTDRILYWNARLIAEEILREIRSSGFGNPVYAGSLRRGKETIGDIDILCNGRPDGVLAEKLSKLSCVERTLSTGPTKVSVILKKGVQVDIRIIPEESFGAALCYFTGSKEHNVLLREIALKKGFTLNEYGLFRISDKKQKKPIASGTEEEIYRALGLQFIPPELREARGELELAAKKTIPELVSASDVKGDIHNHTNLTDGKSSFEEMLEKAVSMGWEWIFIGDHTLSLGVAHGLDYARYAETKKTLEKASAKFPRIKTGRSIEMDILKTGDLDFSHEELEKTDLVIGAVHSSLRMKEEEMTRRILKAMTSPCLDVMAHLSGRMIGKREPSNINYDMIFEEALRHDIAFEINGQPDRQDLTDVYARKAKETGLKIILSTDSHSAQQLEYMNMAVVVARRAGLTGKDVLNSLSYEEFREWISERRKTAG